MAQSDTLQKWFPLACALVSALEHEATPERRGIMFLQRLLPDPHACPFSGLSTHWPVLAALLDSSGNPTLLDGPPVAHETHHVNSSPVLGGTALLKSVSDSLPLSLPGDWEPYLLILKVLSHVKEINPMSPQNHTILSSPKTLVRLTTILHPSLWPHDSPK